ncbi:hypothetical protein [Cellulomonas fimi]|uniref:Uncharacterized protein n=1 Tax=Cellulomonas fimi TaxID=1708 RepID=A0A7Y0LVM9_CELFI|nr:hypothetical protein [Cellulomonas fimi]NMR18711.1 hypothetical protein [Cellulomonas fimi]
MRTTTRSGTLALSDLRHSRRALRAERARVARWRRLLRARMDLAVAAALMPDPLGYDTGGVLPVDAGAGLPSAVELVSAVRDGAPPAELDRLESLRELDRRLATYESTVVRALHGTTDEFIRRLAMDPVAGLRGLADIP